MGARLDVEGRQLVQLGGLAQRVAGVSAAMLAAASSGRSLKRCSSQRTVGARSRSNIQ